MGKQVEEWTFNNPNNDLWLHECFETKEEAIKAAIEYGKENGYKTMEIGKSIPIPLPCYIDAVEIFENLNQQYEDETGGEYEGDLYENVKQEDLRLLELEISKAIHNFHERAGIKSRWNTITNIQEVTSGY